MGRRTSAALEVLNVQPTVIGTLVDLESSLCQALQRCLVLFLLCPRQLQVNGLENLGRSSPRHQVRVIGSRSSLLVRAGKVDLADTLTGNDTCRASLHHGHVVAVFVVILANVMRRVARAHNDRFLALAVGLGAGELGTVAD